MANGDELEHTSAPPVIFKPQRQQVASFGASDVGNERIVGRRLPSVIA